MKTRTPLIAAALLGASLASATLLVHEPFDYTVDSNFRMGTTWESVAIPEPSSLLLLGSALRAFVLFNRRREK
jgi:hypothetical protein